MGECDPRNFLQPCLLLLLRERPDHGYDLASRLRDMHVAEGDPGTVYRALRAMERHGLVHSIWQLSDAGPARRTYRLTTAGVADLERQAALLELTHQTLHEFRGRFERLKEVGGAGRNGNHTTYGHGQHDAAGVRETARSAERAGG
ncbi:MAG TPA: helix-turn-helix transcriptional regulator [Pseudonocardia sp.]|jgi:poly-beta-hydroxybutyrate-responsive repressor